MGGFPEEERDKRQHSKRWRNDRGGPRNDGDGPRKDTPFPFKRSKSTGYRDETDRYSYPSQHPRDQQYRSSHMGPPSRSPPPFHRRNTQFLHTLHDRRPFPYDRRDERRPRRDDRHDERRDDDVIH